MATELWRWQGGTSAEDRAFAIDIGEDGSVIVGGFTLGDWDGLNSGGDDFVVVKLTEEGVREWTWQEGTAKTDGVESLKVGTDGSTFITGGTNGTWGNTTTEGDEDFALAKIDSDGNTLWRWQDGTSFFDWLVSSALLSDGSIIVAGYSYGDWDGEGSAGFQDFAAAILDPDGVEQWRWMDGTDGTDRAHDVAVAEDGSIFILGQTFGSWGDSYAGQGDAALTKLSADGTIVWKWQDGTSEEDYMAELLVMADGSTVLVGYTYGDWDGENAGDSDFASIKLDADGNELWRWQDGTEFADRIYAAAMAEDGCIFLGGYTYGDWNAVNAGLSDFVMLKLDANGTIEWRWQEGNIYTNWITELASRDGKIAVALNFGGDWEEASAGFTDFGVILLESNFTSVNPTPAPTVGDAETPTPTVGDAETPTPTFGDAETPTPTVGDAETPTPTVEDAETPTPTVGDAETPTPTVGDAETPTPTVGDAETPTPVMTPEPFSAPDPTPSPAAEDTGIPTAVMTTMPFSVRSPTPLPLPTLTRSSSSSGNMAIIAGVAGVMGGLILCAILIYLWRKSSRQPEPQPPVPEPPRYPVPESVREPAPVPNPPRYPVPESAREPAPAQNPPRYPVPESVCEPAPVQNLRRHNMQESVREPAPDYHTLFPS